MSEIPRKARVFLWVVYCLGGLSVLAAFTVIPHLERIAARPREIWLLPLFIIGAVAAGQRKIRLFGKNEDAGTMSLSFAVIYASLLHFGPQRALLTGVASTLAGCLLQPKARRQPLFQASFNVAVSIIELVAAGTAFLLINRGTLALDWVHSPTALCAAALVFFFSNTMAVATIIGLCTEENPLPIWRESFMWTAPSFFMGAGAATAVTLISQVVVHNPATSAVTLVCMGLVLYLINATYKMNVARTDALIGSKEQLANLYLSTIRSLALAIDAKDQYTHQHILRVQQYAVSTAKQMGVEGDELKAIETGALLHDIGKLGIPEYILVKPGRLTSDELAKIKEHPLIGADILNPVEFPWPVLPVVKYHHERLDGSGYPEGLKGEEIPRTARILAVADVYDALTSNRSYRNAWTHERALDEIQRCVGTGFDPLVVAAFVQVIDGVLEAMAAESPADLAATSAALAPIAPGLDPALTAREMKRASAELWTLSEVAQTLSSSLGLRDIVNILATRLQAVFPGTGCVFLSAPNSVDNPSPEALVARAAVGLGERFFTECRTLNAQSLSLRVMSTKQTYRGAYDHDDLMPNSVADGAWCDLKSALIVPILYQEDVLGTINVYHPENDAFTEYAQSLLELIADRVAPALLNGMLDERARSQALTDALGNGVANLRFFSDRIEQKIGSGGDSQPKFALVCLDVDQFEPINEVFGHQKGDELLGQLGEIFRDIIGPESLIARTGGDGYAILIDNAGEQEAETAIRRLQDTVANFDPDLRHPLLGDLRVGVSAGSACFPDDGADGNRLLSAADKRMRANKTERKLGRMVDNDASTAAPYLPARLAVASSGLRRLPSPGKLSHPPVHGEHI